MLKRIAESHVDHVPASVVEWALTTFKDRDGFFIETTTLPDHLPTLENGLYGPACGDAPVGEDEVFYANRNGRDWPSRMVRRPKRQTSTVTVIAGPHNNDTCVLYTIFGGPCSPKECNDPYIKPQEQEASLKFWSEHALAE